MADADEEAPESLYRASTVTIPNLCACCGAEDAAHPVPSTGYAGFNFSFQYSLQFPYCARCKGHAAHEHGKRKFNGGLDASLVGLLMLGLLCGGGYLGTKVSLALGLIGNGAALVPVGVLALGAASMVFWVPVLWEKLGDAMYKPDLARGCTDRRPVHFSIVGHGATQLLSFRFGCDKFDARFRLANTPASAFEVQLAKNKPFGLDGFGR